MESQESKSVEGAVSVDNKVVSTTDSFREAVKVKLAAQNDEVKDIVVTKMVAEEKEKRVKLLETAFNELTRLEGELRKNQPDLMVLSEANEEKKYFSTDQAKKRKDLQEKIGKLETAVGKAIKEKDWSSLKQLAESLPKGQ